MSPLHTKSSVLIGSFVSSLGTILTTETISTMFQFGTMAGIVVVAILNRLDARKALKVATATNETTDKIHTLSNSAMGAQLRIVWLQAKRIAEMTKGKAGHKEDLELVAEAERAYLDHQAKQKIVDEAPPRPKP